MHAFATKTIHDRKQIEKNFYRRLCELLLEQIKACTITSQQLLQQITLEDIEVIEQFYKQNRSIILVSGHFCNWEWVANALALQTSYTICAGYQRLHHKGIDRMALHIRTRFQRKAIPMVALLRYMTTYKGSLQATTLLIDQAPLHKRNGYSTTFLAQSTTVTLTAAKLAQKYNHPIFYIQTERIKRGKYRVRPILLTETPAQLSVQEIAERYTRRLEADILLNPACWLWSHRKWK